MSSERRLPTALLRIDCFEESGGVKVKTRLLEITVEGEEGGMLDGRGKEGGGELGGGGGERRRRRNIRKTRNRGNTVMICLYKN